MVSFRFVSYTHTHTLSLYFLSNPCLFKNKKCRSDKDVDHDWLPKAPSLAYDEYSIKEGDDDDEDSYDDETETLYTNDDMMTR